MAKKTTKQSRSLKASDAKGGEIVDNDPLGIEDALDAKREPEPAKEPPLEKVEALDEDLVQKVADQITDEDFEKVVADQDSSDEGPKGPPEDETLEERARRESEEALRYLELMKEEVEDAKKRLIDAYAEVWDRLTQEQRLARWRRYVRAATDAKVVAFRDRIMDMDYIHPDFRGEEFGDA